MVLWWKKKHRVKADLVVGMMYFNPDSEMLLVVKNGKLTIPTGHMEKFETDVKETIGRETEEELKIVIVVRNIRFFGSVLRDQLPDKKSIELVAIRLTRDEADRVDFEEAGQKGQLWVRPSRIKNLALLDPLGQEALGRYNGRFLRKAKGDGYGSTIGTSERLLLV